MICDIIGKSGSKGKGNASSSAASRSVNSGGKQKGVVASGSGTKVESQKAKKGSVFGYVYPTVDCEVWHSVLICLFRVCVY